MQHGIAEWYNEESDDKLYRYALGQPGRHTLLCIALNPHLASPVKNDTTKTKIARFAKDLRYDGFMIMNLYPLRCMPEGLPPHANAAAISENLRAFRNVLDRVGDGCTVWAAWGNFIEKRPYLVECLRDIVAVFDKYSLDGNWIHMGSLTSQGNPRHPSRLSYESDPKPFDVKKYLQAL